MSCARNWQRRLTAALLAAIGLSTSLETRADRSDESAVMLLLAPVEEDDDGYRALEQALDAHLQRLEMEVRAAEVEEIPQSPREQEDLARRILSESSGRAVVWTDQRRRTVVLIHLDDEGRESRLERRIDCIAEHLGRCADAVASVVSSAVSSWAEASPPEDGGETAEVEYAVDNELSPVELNKPPWTRPDPLVHLALGAGYGGAFFDGTAHGVHGFDVDLWVRILRYALVEAAVDFWWPIDGDSSENAAWIEIARWDVAARIGAALPLDRFALSLTAGAVFDFAEIEDRSSEPDFDGSGEQRKGFSTAFTVRYRALDWLAVWLGAGLDALDSDLVYRARREGDAPVTLVRCGAVQGRLFAGAAFVIGFGSMGG
jgi:hypothetical protein